MGFFAKISSGLKKTKEAIKRRLFEAFSMKELDDEFFDELEEALITADVVIDATETLLERIRDEIYENRITKPDAARELFKKILIESIDFEIEDFSYPLVILLSGVNGVGKTTAIGKLANMFKLQGKSVVVAAADTFRAAASEQLEVWGERAGVRVVHHGEGSDPCGSRFRCDSFGKSKGNGRRFD